MSLFKKALAAAAVAVVSLASFADEYNLGNAEQNVGGCINAHVLGLGMINKVCWDCVYPIRVGGFSLAKGHDSRIPDGAANMKLACSCPDNFGIPQTGIPTAFWQPHRLGEFVKVAGCLSSLEAVRLPFSRLFLGEQQDHNIGVNSFAFKHYHWYSYPLMIMLDMYVPGHCNPGYYHDLDVMYLSEVDPTWNNDAVAFFTNPEAVLVASPPAAVACIPDALAALVGKPINKLFWCAGGWGNMYPLSGNVDLYAGTLMESSLQNARVLAALHRRGFETGSMGEDAMCQAEYKMMVPKSQYRIQMYYPRAETDGNHVIGQSPLVWGMSRTKPSTGEDPVYIVWRWVDCCNN